MTDQVSLTDFDRDEAVAEAVDGLRSTRFGLLKGAGALALAGGVTRMVLPGSASARARGSKANDITILNYALTLEYLEAAFYAQATTSGFTGAIGTFASTVA